MRYVLGIDGGGDKTHCALYDADNGRMDMLTRGPYSPEELSKLFRPLLSRNNIGMDDIEMAVLGLSGTESEEQRGVVTEILTELGLPRFILDSDAILGIKAGSESGFGVCAIHGTGSCVAGLDPKGGRIQIGGLGILTGDCGGNEALASRAVGLVYSQLFREFPFTALTTAMFRWLDVTDRNDFVSLITEKLARDRGKTTLELCRILHSTAAEGDEAALALLEESGRCCAGGIIGAVSELSFAPGETLEIVFAGSLFAKGGCTRVQETAEKLVQQRFPQRTLRFTAPGVPNVAGAVLWALSELGITERRDHVLRSFGSEIRLL
jgi:N-acetylglucosamine kinase-like BadF-type ATPase